MSAFDAAAGLRRRLVLASASPRRRELMSQYGYDCEIVPAQVKEVAPAHLTAGEMTLFNARLKANEVARRYPGAVVLGVDTLVSLEGLAIGKPGDMAEAFEMVSRLAGRVHEVFSGVWVVSGETGEIRSGVAVSHVRFRELEEGEIRRYLARIEPLDKAGAYAAQDISPESVVACIEGSRTNVIGLPMELLGQLLPGWAREGR